MILSIILRHFKSHKNINFIPISNGENLTGILGENGIGKSAILEALETYFNADKNWNINQQAKKEGGISGDDKTPFIAPMIILERSQVPAFKKEELANAVSSFYWSTSTTSSTSESKKFQEHLNLFKERNKEKTHETHFLFLLGKRHDDPSKIFIPIFEKELIQHIRQNIAEFTEASDDDIKKALVILREDVCDKITYFYVPVETDPTIYSKLEISSLQSIMDEKIHKNIIDKLNDETISKINADLDIFLGEIQGKLGSGYVYKKSGNKEKLTKKDIADKAIEAYFGIKILHKKITNDQEIPVFNLSSGEKKSILIDLAYSFLTSRNENGEAPAKNGKVVIFAVDEPEASLHQSACYGQFEKLIALSDSGNQTIFTTHWYGFLPIFACGHVVSIQHAAGKRSFDIFDMYNYRESIASQRKQIQGKLPFDISIKSYNDLAQSIISSCTGSSPYNWILCEGITEKIYLENQFQNELIDKHIKILPLGGKVEVKKVYDRLKIPMSDKDYEIKGKVCCFIDTDEDFMEVSTDKSLKNISFLRLINDESINTTRLINVDSNITSPITAIEDALSPKEYIEALREVAKEFDDQKIISIIDSMTPNNSGLTSGIYFDLKKTELSTLKTFMSIQGVKYRLAKTYTSKTPKPTQWMLDLINNFK